MRTAGRRATAAVHLALAALLAACTGSDGRPAKGPGSALWGAPAEVAALGGEEREALRAAGVGELFLEAGRLGEASGGAAGGEIVPAAASYAAVAATRLPVTLAVGGSWPPRADPAALAAALRPLRLAAEEAGATVVGYHLDVAPPRGEAALAAYGEALAALAAALDRDLLLSASLDPESLGADGVAALADGVDFAVAFLYGPRSDGGPGPVGDDAWNLAALDPQLARLADLELPFLVGAGTIGELAHLDAAGNLVATTTRADLAALVGHPGLGLPRTAVLDPLDRQSYRLQAERPLALGDWGLDAGDWLRVTRLSAHDLVRLAEQAAGTEGYLGVLYHRLRRPGEALSPSALALAGAAGGDTATELEVEVEAVGTGPVPFRVRIANRGAQPTEVAFLGHNYVELRALGGAAFADVDAGGFRRYELLHAGRRVDTMRALRQADAVKLYVPLLEPGGVVTSGTVALRGAARGRPVVEVSGNFVLPGGEIVELAPRRWPVPAAEGEAPPGLTP